jgi:histone-lysine N-methyltransferase NSD3
MKSNIYPFVFDPYKVFSITKSSKLNKILDSESEADEDVPEAISAEKLEELKQTLPETFAPGDLGWARIGVAPYWPCTVTRDPDENLHSNVSIRGRKPHREYHVQVPILPKVTNIC